MKKINLNISLILLFAVFFSCKENPVESNQETLIHEQSGIIENLGGDCSAVQIRTRSLSVLDLAGSDKIKFSFNGMSDADLSSISIYYIENDEQINMVNLSDREQINSTQSITVDNPGTNTELFSRVTLKSSVCTGQIYYLTFSNLKIFKVNQ